MGIMMVEVHRGNETQQTGYTWLAELDVEHGTTRKTDTIT